MDPNLSLAPCLIGRGTLANPRDMLRALETLEGVEYCFTVHGEKTDDGRAALVKLMADTESATLVVNGCLFLNVLSFHYLDFEPLPDSRWRFVLHADHSTLELVSFVEAEEETVPASRPHLLFEEATADFESLIALDDEEDDE